MNRVLSVLTLLASAVGVSAAEPSSPDAIVRKPLLTAQLAGEKPVSRVEIKQIDFVPGQKTGTHVHPIPVVGYVASGGIILEIEGQPAQTLHAGEAFYEPADTKILRFDAIDQPTRFIVYYLLSKDDRELIRHTP